MGISNILISVETGSANSHPEILLGMVTTSLAQFSN